MKRFDLGEEERHRFIERLRKKLENHGRVSFAYVYGSFAEGLPFRDIDVGIYLSRVTQEQAVNCGLMLSQELSKEFGMSIDARVINFAPVTFLYHVIRGTLVLERDEETHMRVVERTVQRYLDLKPVILKGIKEAFGR